VSLFTDAATEMIYPLLPVYLSRVLGAGAVSLGLIEGVAEGINSLLKVLSGKLSDRWPRRKPIVLAGYALSSFARPFIGLTTSWVQVLAIRGIDRTGKGIRGAPRDAMLAHYATPGTRGRVYGFHRAMDHAGAIVGPLIATLFLLAWPGQYRVLFALTIIPGALAVWILFRIPETTNGARDPNGSNLPNPRTDEPPNLRPDEPPNLRTDEPSNLRIDEPPNPRIPESPTLPARFWSLLAVILLFSLGNSADAFLLLRLSEAIGSAVWIPLLWSALHVVKASTSVYGGALSDRVGRKVVIAAGWGIYAAVYIGFAAVDAAAGLIACFLAYGTYFGLAEGTEKALVADFAPVARRGTAFGWYNAALGVGALLASVVFGVLYERFGPAAAFATGAVLAAAAAVLLLLIPADKQVYS
jgi:MFS family permease